MPPTTKEMMMPGLRSGICFGVCLFALLGLLLEVVWQPLISGCAPAAQQRRPPKPSPFRSPRELAGSRAGGHKHARADDHAWSSVGF